MDGLREKVIKGLEWCSATIKGCDPCPTECPYYGECLGGDNGVIFDLLKDALSLLKAQDVPDTNVGKWVSVNERMPEEHDTFFAKLKGTDKWKPGLFEKMSDDVRCVVLWPDGTRRVHHSYTVDGRWAVETVPPEGRKVTHWMENPELPKEEA